ncbi:MAG TPA: pyrimidine-nucleoside phosphorylase [Herpetosiphonaceae bacterium]
MRAVDLIVKKRDGEALTREEIAFLVKGYTDGSIPDYQMAAWAMAVLFRGMDDRETTDLTLEMVGSGDELDLSDVAPITVDKHSTGGVGDKTSLVLGPLLAAVGLPVAKMSGRGLGFTGGTLDKLESIPGMKVDMSQEHFRWAVKKIGLVIAGQSADLAPADKKLYALRDVTGTVDSIPLIAASVMSKKLAAGANAIVLDVKVGSGAFMKDLEQARVLADAMVRIGTLAGRKVAAVLSTMDQPLGYAIGNVLEVQEAIYTLRGHGPADLQELCLVLGAQLLLLTGKDHSEAAARRRLESALISGQAWSKFRQFVANQRGNLAYIDEPLKLPAAPAVEPLSAPTAGFVSRIDALTLGLVAAELGAGRQTKESAIDPAVGLELKAKIGDEIEAGVPLLLIHARSAEAAEAVKPRLLGAIEIAAQRRPPTPLVLETLRRDA